MPVRALFFSLLLSSSAFAAEPDCSVFLSKDKDTIQALSEQIIEAYDRTTEDKVTIITLKREIDALRKQLQTMSAPVAPQAPAAVPAK